MTALARMDVDKLAAVLALMSSPFDNEVLIAAKIAEKMRRQAGIGWSDLVLREGLAVLPLLRPRRPFPPARIALRAPRGGEPS
jgi:hypothetical protein